MNRQRGFLLLAVALSGLLGLYVVLPFAKYVLVAVLLAYALHPLHVRLVPRLGPRLSPIALIAFTGAAIVLPFVLASAALVRDLRAIAASGSARSRGPSWRTPGARSTSRDGR